MGKLTKTFSPHQKPRHC